MNLLIAQVLVGLISIMSLVGMIASDSIKIDKSAFALFGGFVTWILAATFLPHETYETMTHPAMLDIVGVVVFLFAAMTIVEGIDHHGGFSVITRHITATNKDKLLVIVALITFFLSATLDNLTTAIVMGALVLKLMKQEDNQLIYASVVVAAANIGGTFSPIGNTTSILLWVGGQMSAGGMMSKLIIPSVASLLMLIMWFAFKLNGHVSKPDLDDFSIDNQSLNLPLSGKVYVLTLGVAGLMTAPLCKIFLHMQPWEGMIGGLVLYQFGTGFYHMYKGEGFQVHYHIKTVLKHVDTSTLYFFSGILMTVAANAQFGNLAILANGLDTSVAYILPAELKAWGITGIIGVISGIIPNTPIVAAAQQMYSLNMYPQDDLFWQLLAYTSGVGGNFLILGSAAGVVMMSVHKKLTFGVYYKIMFVPSIISFLAGFATLYVQNLVLT